MTRPYRQNPSRVAARVARAEELAALYRSGETLESIGRKMNLTRERIRQIMTRNLGVRAVNGGAHTRAVAQQERREFRRNERSLRKWGCTWDQYVSIRSMKKPTRAFSSQKHNADTRGIGWELTLWQWWTIWQQSRQWENRGRGRGYAMCRMNDTGPYAVDNVYIATGSENIQDYWAAVHEGKRARTVVARTTPPTRKGVVSVAVLERYRKSPKALLRRKLLRQGLSKPERDAIVAAEFGHSRWTVSAIGAVA